MLERAAKKLKDPKLRARRDAAWRELKAFPSYEDDEDRRKRLGLDPDLDPNIIAIKILLGEPLEDHERRYAAEIISPRLVAGIRKEPKKKRKKKRVRWATAIALKADRVLERYFEVRALDPNGKHKEHWLPAVAKECHVSGPYIDKALKKLDPARREEMEKRAAAWAKFYKLLDEDSEINGPPPGTVTP
jgi:hypothetical protein